MRPAVHSVLDDYVEAHPQSAALAARARQVLPGGVAHSARQYAPAPLYVDHAAGADKWDADGRRCVDWQMGHGALLIGHAHPAIVDAITRQGRLGTHYGASHALEVRWAELIAELVPCAEMVRFVSSGTEAVMLALRLARSATGRARVAKFAGHFHGWSDTAYHGVTTRSDERDRRGLPPSTDVAVLDMDIAQVARTLRGRDIAALILEPTGAHFGFEPLPAGFLSELRRLTSETGTVLVFDEVVTGFRVAKGGAQEATGITPDIATLGKIVGGGLPAAAVAGRRELLDQLDASRAGALYHPGTFNANPLCAASGVAMLEIVRDTSAVADAAAAGDALCDALSAVAGPAATVSVRGSGSLVHLDAGAAGPALHLGLLAHGAHLLRTSALASAAHVQEHIDLTAEAFSKALQSLPA